METKNQLNVYTHVQRTKMYKEGVWIWIFHFLFVTLAVKAISGDEFNLLAYKNSEMNANCWHETKSWIELKNKLIRSTILSNKAGNCPSLSSKTLVQVRNIQKEKKEEANILESNLFLKSVSSIHIMIEKEYFFV